ncbi:MAG: carbamoyltransferase HypF [Candidatus Acidiferrales bacterium]
MSSACSIRVRGVVQGVGFRPFVFRLARANTLSGWVLNGEQGVEIFLEGADQSLEAFVQALKTDSPPAARITDIEVEATVPVGCNDFTIRESRRNARPSVRISADLPVCADCLRELLDPSDKRYFYPYINCTNCGPRYTVILGLPYDRLNTTMQSWPLDELCAGEYSDPGNRRFHAQPVACPNCGPEYNLQADGDVICGSEKSIRAAAEMLRAGKILAVKGLGGYHLACDATNADTVQSLRNRKYRKEKPFALMAKNLDVARSLVRISAETESLLISPARPIVIAPAKVALAGVAPDNHEFGVMLPYTPLHHLLFAAGAPEVLVMTSANHSSEPIAFEDFEALDRLSDIADGFLIGERPIARRVDDSIARAGVFGPSILRFARGYAPAAMAVLRSQRPILAVGADLKNTITLVVNGQAFVSQHIGDLEHFQSLQAFRQTIEDLLSMYEVRRDDLLVVRDGHPQYASVAHAASLQAAEKHSVQHHRAHIASVLAERGEWEKRVVGVSFDGTGFGDDGAIWGGELFTGSLSEGFERVAHLRRALLAGGDAAAQQPVQAAAGFLAQLHDLPDLAASPFHFPERYQSAMELVRKQVRTFTTSSVGRLFDAAAAVLGFTRETTFEGQAAMWLEQLARSAPRVEPYPFPFVGNELDFRPLLKQLVRDYFAGRDASECARAFQRGIAQGLCEAVTAICGATETDTIVLSGGVFQNELLLEDLKSTLESASLEVWTNQMVPPNDGGISLGQAALASFGRFDFAASSSSKAAAFS